MVFLSDWYPKNSSNGMVFSNRWRNSRRFPNIVVPMLYQDMEMHDVPFGVISVKFQIQQLVTVPILEQYQMKKITWGKLDIKTPKFIIESMLLL
jgi:deoxyhypusine synthase